VMRKAAIKYGSQSTDVVRQKGRELTVTTVNAKCSWTRTLQDGRETTVVRAAAGPVLLPSASLAARADGRRRRRARGLTVPGRAAAQRGRRALQGHRCLGRPDPQVAAGAADGAGVGGPAVRGGAGDLALHGRRPHGRAQRAAPRQGPRGRHVLVFRAPGRRGAAAALVLWRCAEGHASPPAARRPRPPPPAAVGAERAGGRCPARRRRRRRRPGARAEARAARDG